MTDYTTNYAPGLVSVLQQWLAARQGILKQLVSLIAIQSLLAGVGFATRVSVANALGTQAFGDLAFGIAIGTYGLMFIQFGFDKSLVRDLVHFPDRVGELLQTSLIIRFALVVVSAVILAAGMVSRAGDGRGDWGIVTVAIATALAAFQLQGLYDSWNEIHRHALYQLIERSVYFALIWSAILLPFVTITLFQVGMFMLAAAAVGLVLQYRWAWPRISFVRVQGLRPTARFFVQSNTIIWLAVLAGLSLEYLSQIILKLYSGSSELGGYSAAWLIVRLSTLVLAQVGRIGTLATARRTRADQPVRQRAMFLAKYVGLMAGVGTLMGLPCILFADRMLTLFSPEFSNAASTLRILGFYPLLFGPYLAVLQFSISMRWEKTYLGFISLAGAFSVAICFWLIPEMKSIGAALSVVLSLGLALTLFLAAACWHLRREAILSPRHS